jgi:hypothetical protein
MSHLCKKEAIVDKDKRPSERRDKDESSALRRKRKKKQGKLLERDVKDLMKMNRPTCNRGKGGAFKQR